MCPEGLIERTTRLTYKKTFTVAVAIVVKSWKPLKSPQRNDSKKKKKLQDHVPGDSVQKHNWCGWIGWGVERGVGRRRERSRLSGIG